jgi:hypothetical protein
MSTRRSATGQRGVKVIEAGTARPQEAEVPLLQRRRRTLEADAQPVGEGHRLGQRASVVLHDLGAQGPHAGRRAHPQGEMAGGNAGRAEVRHEE